MEKKVGPMIQITEADKEKSYFKYLQRDPVELNPQKLGCIFGGPIAATEAVDFRDRKKIVTDQELGKKMGYTVMPDGTGYISDITFMPEVTVEMLDWYFGWRGLDPLRDVIVDPKEHMGAVTMQSHKFLDEDLIGPEKYWDTTQSVTRMSETGPMTEFVNFKCPLDVGFDMDEIEKNSCRLICTRGYAKGMPPVAGPDRFMVHQVIPEEDGVSVATKCWIGWTVRYGKDYKQLPEDFRMPPVFVMNMYQQIAKDWENLAKILPTLYREETDR